jgi:hypothetical protein
LKRTIITSKNRDAVITKRQAADEKALNLARKAKIEAIAAAVREESQSAISRSIDRAVSISRSIDRAVAGHDLPLISRASDRLSSMGRVTSQVHDSYVVELNAEALFGRRGEDDIEDDRAVAAHDAAIMGEVSRVNLTEMQGTPRTLPNEEVTRANVRHIMDETAILSFGPNDFED